MFLVGGGKYGIFSFRSDRTRLTIAAADPRTEPLLHNSPRPLRRVRDFSEQPSIPPADRRMARNVSLRFLDALLFAGQDHLYRDASRDCDLH